MESHDRRRSDRVYLEVPILVVGTDCENVDFVEQTRTILVGRQGAKILLNRKLTPEQEITIRCLETNRESDARVIGQTGSSPEGFYYGVRVLDTAVNLWGVEFPPRDEAESAAGRVLLECIACHTRELVYLDGFDVEVLEVKHYLSRECKKCRDTSNWKETELRPGEELHKEVPLPPPPPPPKRTQNERKYGRHKVKVDVCIRDPQGWEEVAVIEDFSKGGFRFRSKRRYSVGRTIEAALPYKRGGANIFVAAKIRYVEEVPNEGAWVCGAAYIPYSDPWPDRG
jgi:hypothetical protein